VEGEDNRVSPTEVEEGSHHFNDVMNWIFGYILQDHSGLVHGEKICRNNGKGEEAGGWLVSWFRVDVLVMAQIKLARNKI
jgi:hypothetical protein